MTDPNRHHLIVIGDRSGSMHDCREATEEGINGFLETFKAVPKRITASLYEFDDKRDAVFEHVEIADAPRYRLVPRGTTALLDAIGFAFTREGEWLASMPEDERPGGVTVTIATDGKENASIEWLGPQDDPTSRIRALITQQREVYGWEVLFVGANIDAIQVGASIGVPQSRSLSYRATTAGTSSTYGTLSTVGFNLATNGGAAFAGFTDADRRGAMGEDKDVTP